MKSIHEQMREKDLTKMEFDEELAEIEGEAPLVEATPDAAPLEEEEEEEDLNENQSTYVSSCLPREHYHFDSTYPQACLHSL